MSLLKHLQVHFEPWWPQTELSTNGGRPDWAISVLSSSGSHPDWVSATSLTDETISWPSGPNRARLRGVPHMAPSLLTSSPASDMVTTRPPARSLRLIGCGVVGWNVLWSNRPTLPPHVLSSLVRPIPESGASDDKSCPNHRGRTCSAVVRGLLGSTSRSRIYSTENGHSHLKLSRPGRHFHPISCRLLYSLLISFCLLFHFRTPVRSVSFFQSWSRAPIETDKGFPMNTGITRITFNIGSKRLTEPWREPPELWY